MRSAINIAGMMGFGTCSLGKLNIKHGYSESSGVKICNWGHFGIFASIFSVKRM